MSTTNARREEGTLESELAGAGVSLRNLDLCDLGAAVTVAARQLYATINCTAWDDPAQYRDGLINLPVSSLKSKAICCFRADYA